jgi:hypothetical protein
MLSRTQLVVANAALTVVKSPVMFQSECLEQVDKSLCVGIKDGNRATRDFPI